ncbi:phytoene synthase, partial [Streptomyces clavuligerus]
MTETRQTPAEAPADPVTRHTLDQATAENFPVAPFFLPRAWRHDLMALYGYARLVDDIGDGDLAPGGGDARLLGVPPEAADDRLALLDALEADLRRVFDPAPGGVPGPRHPLLRALRSPVRDRSLTIEPFLWPGSRPNRRTQFRPGLTQLTKGLPRGTANSSAQPPGPFLALPGKRKPLTPRGLARAKRGVHPRSQNRRGPPGGSEDFGPERIYFPA